MTHITTVYNQMAAIFNPAVCPKDLFITDDIQSILYHRGVEYETVRTERAGHAHKFIQTVDPRQYSGVVTVSGDGLVHEVTLFDIF